ncbi:hypothetical protein DENSPDRAFT_880375 [Dentipellis sp. KUC8613]|nr:hypothetical protein DENSPDRAFT_880375 [Dentipellis sp. KUC8613]
MNLHISRDNLLTTRAILNTVLRDDHGEPRYRIETSFEHTRENETTISRFLPETGTSGTKNPPAPSVKGNTAEETDILLRSLSEQEFAKIEWHRFHPTVFKWAGKTVEIDSYMPYSNTVMTKRAFTATDGKSYVWKLGTVRSSLTRNDGTTETPIATYHRGFFGLMGKTDKPYLEISSEGLNILDEIVVTFVYIERRRQQRERGT